MPSRSSNGAPAGFKAWLGSGGVEKIALVLALCLVSYGVGLASMRAKVFPYGLIEQAAQAWDALRNQEPDRIPPSVIKLELGPPTTPVIKQLSPRAGHENLLIAGGFFYRMDLCPKFGCLAWLSDRSGKVLHVWPAPDPAAFFKDASKWTGRTKPTNFYVMGMDFGRDGSIVAAFQANNTFPYHVGIAKFDRDGKLLWRHDDFSHHWPTVGPDGQIYTPYMKLATKLRFAGGTQVPIECETGKTYAEGVRVLGPDGTVRHEFDLTDSLLKAGYPGLLYSVRDGCDPLHVNGISLLNAAAAAKLGARAGDLLVSVRSSSALVVVDQSTGEVRKVIVGRSAAQHSPLVLPDGNLLTFDNLGGERGKGGSRVLWIDPATDQARSVFPGPATRGSSLYSDTRGVVDVSPDGKRVLITSSQEGRVIEADIATGEALWSFDNVMDFDPYLKPRKIKSQAHNARLIANGAYYVSADFMSGAPAR